MTIDYSRDTIRELLIDAVHQDEKALKFLKQNLNNEKLLLILLEIVKDDYSGDARMKAAYVISQYKPSLLVPHEKALLEFYKDEWESVYCHIGIALAKMKSKEGLKIIIQDKIKPVNYWEAMALEYYIDDMNFSGKDDKR